MNLIKPSLIIFTIWVATCSLKAQESKVLDYATVITFENNRLVTEKSFMILVTSKKSAWLADINIPFSENDKLEIIEAVVIGPDGGQVRKLKKKDLVTVSHISEEAFYDDDLIKKFSLRWSQYPYIVKYRYRITTKDYVYFARWFPLIYSKIATEKASLAVNIPLSLVQSYDVNNPTKVQVKEEIDNLGMRWEFNKIDPIVKEIFSPPPYALTPSVTVIPKTFNYTTKGKFASWEEYGQWHYEVNKDLDDLPASEVVKVGNLIKGKKDKTEIIKTLYYYMQDNTRYINVSIDEGGLIPYPAGYVCSNKYGDCKALTIYMKALLKQAGIESFYTLVYAGENIRRIRKDKPGQQFNHVILAVPLGQDTLWLENTDSHYPANYIGSFTQNRYGLLIADNRSQLVKIPAMTINDVTVKNRYEFKLNWDGSSNVVVDKELKGESYERYKYLVDELSASEQDELMYDEQFLDNASLTSWNFAFPGRDSAVIKLHLELKAENLIRKAGSFYLLKTLPPQFPQFSPPELRKNPVRINAPVNTIDTLHYILPYLADKKVTLPDPVDIKTDVGFYWQKASLEENNIVLVRQFVLYQNDFTLEEYPKLYSFISTVKEKTTTNKIVIETIK